MFSLVINSNFLYISKALLLECSVGVLSCHQCWFHRRGIFSSHWITSCYPVGHRYIVDLYPLGSINIGFHFKQFVPLRVFTFKGSMNSNDTRYQTAVGLIRSRIPDLYHETGAQRRRHKSKQLVRCQLVVEPRWNNCRWNFEHNTPRHVILPCPHTRRFLSLNTF